MSIPKTKARNAHPGDNVRILLEDAIDTRGREWRKGETVTPLSGGYDNARSCEYMLTTGGTRFEAR